MPDLKPTARPVSPYFSSGPCAKRPGWSVHALEGALLGRSHRAKMPKAQLSLAIEKTKSLLGVPDDYRVGIVPASDTGAIEMAMWSLLGARGVDVLAWESFGATWVSDILKQLRLDDVRSFQADYGKLPALDEVDFDRDVVFTWNGTTSGVCVPNADFIPDDRQGLTICDATSAVFAMHLDWTKLDVTTFSWQKVLGGEAQHGMIILSPRAVERLESYTPSWPMPKIFRMTKGGKLIEGIFRGETINTPSMLCVADYMDALSWAEQIGGLEGLISRANQSLHAIATWLEGHEKIAFLAEDPSQRSSTSVCLKITDARVTALSDDEQKAICKKLSSLLEAEDVAYDINGYRDAPAGLRIWCGATVDPQDVALLLPWIDWALEKTLAGQNAN